MFAGGGAVASHLVHFSSEIEKWRVSHVTGY
jgi:hypothetical protein